VQTSVVRSRAPLFAPAAVGTNRELSEQLAAMQRRQRHGERCVLLRTSVRQQCVGCARRFKATAPVASIDALCAQIADGWGGGQEKRERRVDLKVCKTCSTASALWAGPWTTSTSRAQRGGRLPLGW
jgi:hypothetical protein